MVTVHNIGELGGSILEFVTDLRDVEVHGERERFRRNMERVGFLLGNELSKKLAYEELAIETPLQKTHGYRLCSQPVVATILRAGLPLWDGVMQVFPQADSAFLAAYRKHDTAGNFTIKADYCTCPDMSGRLLIVADPMLATGASLLDGIDKFLAEGGQPSNIHVVVAIASQEGVDAVRTGLEKRGHKDATIWCGAIDPKLNSQKYIVPGLGDAGDLAFGPKKQS
ncbi:uracil phosphoribosyltransferase [Candidatus Saccharibacteria bacterium]|nr:MAG: uracil phosphoribosyltransferase [Candidatus Saccharibacteria bacterium]